MGLDASADWCPDLGCNLALCPAAPPGRRPPGCCAGQSCEVVAQALSRDGHALAAELAAVVHLLRSWFMH